MSRGTQCTNISRGRLQQLIRILPSTIPFLLVAMLSLPFTCKAAEMAPVTLGAGESLILPAVDATRVAIAEPRIADVAVVSRTEVLLTGRAPGETTLHVWDKDGLRSMPVHIFEKTAGIIDEMKERIGLPGVEPWMHQGTVVLEGTVDTSADKQRALQVAGAYGKVVDLLTVRTPQAAPTESSGVNAEVVDPAVQDAEMHKRLEELAVLIDDQALRLRIVNGALVMDGSLADASAQERARRLAALYFPQVVDVTRPRGQSSTDEPELATRIAAAIDRAGLVVRTAGNRIVLEGTLRDQNELTRALNIAGGYGKEVMNLVALTNPLQVALKVHVLEVDRTGEGELGVTWGSLNRGVLETNAFNFGEIFMDGPIERLALIGAKIQTLVENGHAKLLAAPTVLTLSGETAQFLAGGEIPVAMPQGDDKYLIEWKEYGVRLELKPVVDARGFITVSLTPEVSTLDWANAIKLSTITLPAMRTRRTQTQVRVEDGATLVLGGLISQEESKQAGKMPWLADLPVVGMLFRSEKFSNGETELLFLVTPYVMKDGGELQGASVIGTGTLAGGVDSGTGAPQGGNQTATGVNQRPSVLDMLPQSAGKGH